VRRSSFAEDLLSVFAARDRAVTIVGDLTEQSRARGRGWLMREIARVALALLFRPLFAAPWRALRVAGVGLAVYAVVYAVVFVASGLPWYPWHRVGESGFWIRAGLVVVASNFLTGIVLGQRPPNGSISPIAPLTVLWLAAWLISLVSIAIAGPSAWPLDAWQTARFLGVLGFPVLYLLPLLLGAVIARRRVAAGTPLA
jgi:hypothetical protein